MRRRPGLVAPFEYVALLALSWPLHHIALHRKANENHLPLNQFSSEAWCVSLIVVSWQEINSDGNCPLCGVPMRSMLPMWFVIMELHL